MTSEARARARVVVVGGGYTGAAVAVQLAGVVGAAAAIAVVEPREELGRGVAYSTSDPDHRLNGPLDNHLLDPARPDDLRAWCVRERILERDPEARAANGATYLRRSDFGAFVGSAVREMAASGRAHIRHVRADAIDLVVDAGRTAVVVGDGEKVAADLVVVATGNGAPVLPGALAGVEGHPGLIANPFESAALAALPPSARVLLVGSGLTALDVASTLLRRGHRGPIHSLSRHGIRPRSHRKRAAQASASALLARIEGPVPAHVAAALAAGGVRSLSREVRRRIAESTRRGGDWQEPFDEVRNVVWQFWPGLDETEKRRFLRHLRIHYDAHRFRVPPQTEALVGDGQRHGSVVFHAGHIRSIGPTADGALRARWEEKAAAFDGEFDAIVNCTGLDPAFGARSNPFLSSLLARGIIARDPSGIGFAVDARGRPLGSGGWPSPGLRMAGPPAAGSQGDPLGVIFIAPQIRRMLPGMLAELGFQAAVQRAAG